MQNLIADINERVLFENIKNFCKNFVNYDIVESNLKAYHAPPVILKFVQFHVKDKVYKLIRLLKADSKNNRKPVNPVNGKLIYINERLSPIESIIKFAAEDMNYVTSPYKSAVPVPCFAPSDPKGINKKFVRVNSIEDLSQIQYPV